MSSEVDFIATLPERYRDFELLGEGAMGTVYRAFDQDQGLPVAIKFLAVRLVESPELLARFTREAKIQSRIDHPHVVRIHASDLKSRPPYLVMEFVQGKDLESLLETSSGLPPEQVLRLARELGGALDTLHGQGVMHRDLKPANILLRDSDGSAVVMDLGLAHLSGATVLTRTGAMLGTPFYLSPEVIQSKGWRPASDQYQLAAILFEALTGQRLVQADSLDTLLQRIQEGHHTRWPAHLAHLSGIQAALARGTARTPEERFANCTALAEAMATEPPPAPKSPATSQLLPPGKPSQGPWRQLRARFRRPTRWLPSVQNWGILGWSLLAIGLVVGMLWHQAPSPREIRYQMVGNTLRVQFRGGPDEGVHLQIGDEYLQPGPPGEDGLRTILVPSLPEDRATQARLVWPGGRDPWSTLTPERAAVSPRLELAEEGQVRVHLHRPLSLAWIEDQELPIWRSFPAGPTLLRPPRKPSPTWTLAWLEEGLEFSRSWEVAEFLEQGIQRILEETRQLDPLGVQAQRLALPSGQRGSDPLLQDRRRVFALAPWLRDLLQRPLPSGPRSQLLDRWQEWELSALQGLILGEEVELARLPPDSPGGRVWGLPGKDYRLVRLIQLEVPEAQGMTSKGIHLTTREARLVNADSFQSAATEIRFHWPQHPRLADLVVALSLGVRGLDGDSLLEVTSVQESQQGPSPGEGPQPRYWFWSEDLGKPQGALHKGWLTLFLAADLVPPAGTPMQIHLRSARTPSALLTVLTGARLAWKQD